MDFVNKGRREKLNSFISAFERNSSMIIPKREANRFISFFVSVVEVYSRVCHDEPDVAKVILLFSP